MSYADRGPRGCGPQWPGLCILCPLVTAHTQPHPGIGGLMTEVTDEARTISCLDQCKFHLPISIHGSSHLFLFLTLNIIDSSLEIKYKSVFSPHPRYYSYLPFGILHLYVTALSFVAFLGRSAQECGIALALDCL